MVNGNHLRDSRSGDSQGMRPPYEIAERMPTLDEYLAICAAVGWDDMLNLEAARVALPNSLYGVVARSAGQTVGMGRIVGDGAMFFYIQDVVVLPEHQRRGVGTLIMERLMAHIQATAPAMSFVGLFAAAGATPFYARYGFQEHTPQMKGMFHVVLAHQQDHSAD